MKLHRNSTLQWRHNKRDGVSNHQTHDCLLNRLFRRRSKKTSKLRVTGLCEGNSPVTGEFPAQRASNAGNVSIWWRHHDIRWDPVTPTAATSTTRAKNRFVCLERCFSVNMPTRLCDIDTGLQARLAYIPSLHIHSQASPWPGCHFVNPKGNILIWCNVFWIL